MKKTLTAALTLLVSAANLCLGLPGTAKAENPLFQTSFTPDPAPVVFGDELYVFTGNDKEGSTDFYHMTDWQCFSTKDMKNWTNHGNFMNWDDFSWGKLDSAWASQCIERNGKYYFYVTLETNNGRAIGVAVADQPEGPYKDALGKPLCGPSWEYIDPTVMIDDDGQAWLMFGNPTCYYVKLNEDMISTNGPINHFEMNSGTFGPSSGQHASSYGEGPWIYKHGDLYYLVFAAFYGSDTGESMGYSTAPTITGPWTYRGQLMKPLNCFTTHGGIIDYKDHSYFFYHKTGLKGGGSFMRSACCEEFTYGADGSIPLMTSTNEGPAQIEALDPFERVEAETICWCEGVKVEKCSEGGANIGNIQNGSYIKISGADFGSGAEKFTASVASAESGGTIELHTDSKDGPVIGECTVSGTGGWQNWEEVSCDVSVEGEHDLYLVFKGGSGYLFNVDWWKFDGAGSSGSSDDGYIIRSSFEKSAEGWSGRGSASVTRTEDEAFSGSGSVFVTGREAAWNGVVKQLGYKFKSGESYSFSANVKYTEGEPTNIFHFTLQYDDASGDTQYEKIATKTVEKDKWTQLANTDFTIPAGAKNCYIYVETEGDEGIDFYADEIMAAAAGTVIPGAGGEDAVNVTPGDLNGDGMVNAFDVVLARQAVVAASSGEDFDREALLAADVDGSGECTVADLIQIANFALGKITVFEKAE